MDQASRSYLPKLKAWQGSVDVLTTANNAPALTGPSVPLLQANFDSAEYYTVQFGITYPDPPTLQIANPIATLIWSVEGNNIRRKINVGNGTVISAPGEAVAIYVQDATPNTAPAGNKYNVQGQVTRGVRPSSTIPPTLRPANPFDRVFNLAAASFVQIPIPQNAGVVSAFVMATYVTTGNPVDCQVSAVDAGAFAYTTWDPSVDTGFVALPPNATILLIANRAAAANTLILSVIFGIDG